jgi:hypothetical protein
MDKVQKYNSFNVNSSNTTRVQPFADRHLCADYTHNTRDGEVAAVERRLLGGSTLRKQALDFILSLLNSTQITKAYILQAHFNFFTERIKMLTCLFTPKSRK